MYTWGIGFFGSLGLGDFNDRNVPVLVELYYPPVTNLTKQRTYYKIQDAIDEADSGDTIEAQEYIYEEPVNFGSKTLTLQSTNPYSWDTVAQTIIDAGGSGDGVDFSNNNGSTLTGFSITNGTYGVYSYDSQVTIDRCIIENNSYQGLESSSSSMIISNNIIRNNGQFGVNVASNISGVAPEITDNWIYNNGASSFHHGIQLSDMTSQAIIRNNTIVNNKGCGIKRTSGTAPAISNCIVWDNNSTPFSGITNVNYCSFNQQGGISGNGNTNSDPCLAGTDNLHIRPGSVCIDAGDPSFTADANETDIDNEPRVVDGNDDGIERVDIGADGLYDSQADFDDSNYVNFIDFAMFAPSWATKSGDPDYNDLYDLEDDDVIDYKDLSLFCDDWLWQAAWASSQQMMMAMGGGGDNLESIGMESVTTTAVKLEVPQPVWLNHPPQIDPQQRAAFVEDALDWLDGLWEGGELGDTMTYEQYIEFRESIKLFAEE